MTRWLRQHPSRIRQQVLLREPIPPSDPSELTPEMRGGRVSMHNLTWIDAILCEAGVYA